MNAAILCYWHSHCHMMAQTIITMFPQLFPPAPPRLFGGHRKKTVRGHIQNGSGFFLARHRTTARRSISSVVFLTCKEKIDSVASENVRTCGHSYLTRQECAFGRILERSPFKSRYPSQYGSRSAFTTQSSGTTRRTLHQKL